jgi:prepilin-type N-terminal cleavage/methylation domain-containing protein
VVSQRIRRILTSARGYTLTELIVVLAIAAVTMGVAIPPLWTYYRSAALRGAAEQTVTMLNGARQLAIRLNTTVCVTRDSTGMQYHVGTCTTAAWTGTGTDSAGYMRLDTGLTLGGADNLCFSYLGAGTATPGPCAANGTLTITRTQGGMINVIVATTGRVKIQ